MFLNPIRLNLRRGDSRSTELNLARILKKAQEPDCPPRFRTEINLEAVKAFRALGRASDAEILCDRMIANIPAECFDLLSALKRIRSLLYLDAGELMSARTLIEETDGLELNLQGGITHIDRRDSQVTVETWLISVEVALAQNDIEAAQGYFEKAIVRLSSEESELRRKRVNFMERRKLERYYRDLGQILNLYGFTLGLLTGDGDAKQSLSDLCFIIASENEIAFVQESAGEKKKMPNVPLHSRMLCLLGEWSETSGTLPVGIPLNEARRWSLFGSPERYYRSFQKIAELPVQTANTASSALVSIPVGETTQMTLTTADNTLLLNNTLQLMEKLANSFTGFERLFPDVGSYLRGENIIDYKERHFGGHILDTDLFNLLHNCYKLGFTGFIKLVWDKELFKSAVVKGLLPEVVKVGEAILYANDGFVIDAVFKGQNVNEVATAQDNFLLITRMCFSIYTDDIQPDILAKSHQEPAVAERPRRIRVKDSDLIAIIADIEEAFAGIEKEEGALDFFDAQTKANLAELALPESNIVKPVVAESFFELNIEAGTNKKPCFETATALDDENILQLL